MENDEQLVDELTCRFKIDMRNLTNFDPSTQKPQKFELERATFIQSRKCMSIKFTEELYVMMQNF